MYLFSNSFLVIFFIHAQIFSLLTKKTNFGVFFNMNKNSSNHLFFPKSSNMQKSLDTFVSFSKRFYIEETIDLDS